MQRSQECHCIFIDSINCFASPTLSREATDIDIDEEMVKRVRAVEMSYLRGACGVSRWDGLSNESVYERCGMRVCAVEMSYLRGARGVSRWDGMSNESVYERCGMKGRGSGVGCGRWNG